MPETVTAEAGERQLTAARKAQGFVSQDHLDAFYRAYDHVQECGECGQPGPAAWLEGDASWQPTETRCAVARRLDLEWHTFSGLSWDATGAHATITGVAFTWTLRCGWCREHTHLTTSGIILAGLDVSRSGKTCRSYQWWKPGRPPVPPDACPACGKEYWFSREPLRDRRPGHGPCPDGELPVLHQVWRELDDRFPEERKRAHEALLARQRDPHARPEPNIYR